MSRSYDLFIGNESVADPGQERFAAIDLFSREEWASLAQATPRQFAQVVEAARQVFETGWGRTKGIRFRKERGVMAPDEFLQATTVMTDVDRRA